MVVVTCTVLLTLYVILLVLLFCGL